MKLKQLGRSYNTKTAAGTSTELLIELADALRNPREVFGYAAYGNEDEWPQLNKKTGGIQPQNLAVLAASPKDGKSLLAGQLAVGIARQAQAEGKGRVVRIITLEMKRKSYQRRMAASMAGISDSLNIRRGMLTAEEQEAYKAALDELATLPIEYLSNERDLTDEETFQSGRSSVTIQEVEEFVRGKYSLDGEHHDTYWWVVDHIGLLADLSAFRDVTTNLFTLANRLKDLAHDVESGLVITHLTKDSVGGEPTMESVGGSYQIVKNADIVYLIYRPFKNATTEEDKELVKDGEPVFLKFYSRDEGSGMIPLWFDRYSARFSEMDVPEELIPKPASKKGKK